MLPSDLGRDGSEARQTLDWILKTLGDASHVGRMKLLLCALYAYPYGTEEELETLKKKLAERGADVAKEVMVFCYSKLSTRYKSCLQYRGGPH